MKIDRRAFLLGTAGSIVTLGLPRWARAAGERVVLPLDFGPRSPAPVLLGREILPPVRLRGYGALSASFQRLKSTESASILQITGESAAKASLVQAKYLSDLGLLPGTEAVLLKSETVQLPAVQVPHQGTVAALRQGRDVFVLSAASPPDLLALYQYQQARQPGAYQFTSETAIPMYLDRWDKHGFLFYYRTWETPEGQSMSTTYPFHTDFEWEKAHGDLGLVFWDEETANDTAEGLMNHVWWNWAAREAVALNLPMHINTSASTTTWLLNRFRDETAQKMPQFVGNYYGPADPGAGGQGLLSWNSQAGADVDLGLLQSSVKHFAPDPNVVGWLEPHGELRHSQIDLLMEYGPVSDRAFQVYLRQTYQTLGAVNARWKTRLKSWGEARVPELASFLGWGPDALDLQGTWRVAHENAPDGKPFPVPGPRADGNNKVTTQPTPPEWFQPDFDDGAWGTLDAPGHDRQMFLPKRPAVYRRSFDVPAAWKAAHSKLWLYVWDLSMAYPETVRVFLNGQAAGESATTFNTPHWAAFDVSLHVQAGQNHLALRLPGGILAYRTYLSPHPPLQYPHLGPAQNAQWVDFADWMGWSRLELARRGTEMIRQADPNRPITFMAPDVFADGIKTLCERYGGQFHDTGFMGAQYADQLPALMRGSDLPFDLEPGGPPSTVPDFLHMMGLFLCEGIQGVSYFIHIGDVLWNPGIRAKFEENLPLYQLIGKHHPPPAEVAVLYSLRNQRLTDYPWGSDLNVNLHGGYWNWNIAANIGQRYPQDAVTERDFANGNASKYKVVVDSNTSLMEEAVVDDVEAWVRAGGTFVTFVQTGRHSPTRPDSWPISRLTGYNVTHIDRYDDNGQIAEWRTLKPAPNQTVFADWPASIRANGLTLQKASAECQDLMLWDDGSAAIGMRPLGKGFVVQVGPKFHGQDHMFDRLEPGGNNLEMQAVTRLYSALLDWRKIAPIPALAASPSEVVLLRHTVSNNGLHDVWTLWNQDRKQAVTTDLTFAPGLSPAECLDVKTGQAVPITRDPAGDKLAGLTLPPLETRIFLSPRGDITQASLRWLQLQRAWWRGATPPPPKTLPTPTQMQTHTLPLGEDWAFLPLESVAAGDITAMTAPEFNDAAWERRAFGLWGLPDHPNVKHGLFRKRFTVPAHWKTGQIALWVQSWFNTTFMDAGRVYVDGRQVQDFRAEGMTGDTLGGLLAPGTSHTLAVEIRGNGTLNGARGTVWLAWTPAPQASLDLAGPWVPSRDALHDDAPVTLPGAWDALLARRTVRIPAAQSRRNAVLSVNAEGRITGVIINGSYLRRHHHAIGPETRLNITPWVRWGQDNDVQIVHGDSPGQAQIKSLALDFYDRGVYP